MLTVQPPKGAVRQPAGAESAANRGALLKGADCIRGGTLWI